MPLRTTTSTVLRTAVELSRVVGSFAAGAAEPPSTARFAVLRTIPERDNGDEND